MPGPEPHTPGPWPKDYVHEAVRHIARNCDFIVSRSNPEFPGWDRYNGDSDLIAEAPNLLDAAMLAFPILAAYRGINHMGHYNKQVAAADALEAAITAATGVES